MRVLKKMRKIILAAIFALLVVWPQLSSAFLAQKPSAAKARPVASAQAQPKIQPARPHTQASARPRPKRKVVYPHSVVPGGVASADEVRQAMKSDKVVQQHFQGVQVDKLTPFCLNSDIEAFVSYRVDGSTYWTNKKVKLRKGEQLLSDGKNWVRCRCGNRVSNLAQSPCLPPAFEPRTFLPPERPAPVIERPGLPPVMTASLPLVPSPFTTEFPPPPVPPSVPTRELEKHKRRVPPFVFFLPAAGLAAWPHNSPPVVVPEPGAQWALILAGLAVAGYVLKRKRAG